MIKTVIRKTYEVIGLIICRICLAWWGIRDRLCPPETDSVLFIAHPDDDTLFFHSFITENKPYVCLMTLGYSLKRMPDFIKVMRRYGVRYRAYPLDSRDNRFDLLKKQVGTVMKLADFKTVATHNKTGEYGHEEHIRVHDAVMSLCQSKPVLCPVDRSKIKEYPLDDESIKDKRYIFENFYKSEKWVLDEEESGAPVWVTHEQLEVQ